MAQEQEQQVTGSDLAVLKFPGPDRLPSVFEYEGVHYTDAGLSMPADLPFNIWEGLVEGVDRIRKSIEWVTGDVLNYGEHKYGETYSQAITVTQLSDSTLQGYKWVAGVFPIDTRRTDVSFSHHEAVASLYGQAPDVALEILDRAVEEGLTVREVRHDVRQARLDMGLPPDDMRVTTSSHQVITSTTKNSTQTVTTREIHRIGDIDIEASVEWLDDLLGFVVELGSVDPEHRWAITGVQTRVVKWMIEHNVPFLEDKSVI